MENLLWEEAAKFHGHKCPGLAIGVKACEAIITKMNLNPKEDKIICISENNTCPVDGIKSIFGCDFDKKTLFYEETDELAFNIFNLKDNNSLRIIYKDKANILTKEEKINHILNADINDIFDIGKVKFDYKNIK